MTNKESLKSLGIEPDTPHGKAQLIFDRMVAVSKEFGNPVTFEDPSAQKVPTEKFFGPWIPIDQIDSKVPVEISFVLEDPNRILRIPARVYQKNGSR